MPTHTTTVPEYCEGLTRSRLLTEPEVKALHDRWRREANGADADVDQFRRFLVQHSPLTEYQAALVQRGHTEGFFVGGYTILERIGKGRAAGVYRAAHPSGQVVALKVLPASKARDPETLARFQREGRLLTQLDHPNVVRAFQLGQSGGIHFIVMEHLDGETLDEVLARRKKLPPPEAVRLIHQALRGLQHLHEKRMVHRDLKPANLMVVAGEPGGPPPRSGADTTLGAAVKILDIGIGRELFDEDSPDDEPTPLTAEGVVLGTPDYLAPEQARDARSADIRSDIYSLGCVLFHLIAGRPPFADKALMALVVRHATEPPPALASAADGVPPGLQAVFERMTAKKPDDRYRTPAEAADALAPFLPASGGTVAAAPVLPAYRRWLETESSAELPAVVAPPLPATPAAPARPAAAPPPPTDEIDVELVTPPPVAPAADRAGRSSWDLTRRDFVMLGIGAGGMLAAVVAGYGLGKLFRPAAGPIDPEPERPAPEKK
jgi:serine/threonine protein kinase